MPQAVVDKIAAEAIAVVKEPDVVPQFAALGMEPAGEGPLRCEDIDAEIERVTKVVESAGIKPQ